MQPGQVGSFFCTLLVGKKVKLVSLFIVQRANKWVLGSVLRGFPACLISFYPYNGSYLISLIRKLEFRNVKSQLVKGRIGILIQVSDIEECVLLNSMTFYVFFFFDRVFFLFFFLFWAVPRGLQDPSSLSRD